LFLVLVLLLGWGAVMITSTQRAEGIKNAIIQAARSAGISSNKPWLSTVNPREGFYTGQTGVTLTGRDFQVGATVKFGGNLATGVAVQKIDTITAYTPPGPIDRTVSVTVENPDGGAATRENAFTYRRPPPMVRGITPLTAAANTPITIWGVNFYQTAAQRPTLTMNGVDVPVTYQSDTVLLAPAPATPVGAGATLARVVVTNPDQQSSPEATFFTYP
jgi:hypothetical protein